MSAPRYVMKAQSWMVWRIKQLIGKDINAGVCFGMALMTRQAMLAKDLDTFDQRLRKIHDIPLEFKLDMLAADTILEQGKLYISLNKTTDQYELCYLDPSGKKATVIFDKTELHPTQEENLAMLVASNNKVYLSFYEDLMNIIVNSKANVALNNFPNTLANINAKRLKIVTQIKKQVGPFRVLKADEKELIEQDADLQLALQRSITVIDSLIANNELQATERETEISKRREQFIFNAFVQKQIEDEIAKLPADDRTILDIQTFLEDLVIYHLPRDFPYLFEPEKATISQNQQLVTPLVISKKLESQNGICDVANFSGAYMEADLFTFFESLRLSFEKSALPNHEVVTLVLNSNGHAITIGYDLNSKKWLFNDINLQTQNMHDDLPATLRTADSREIAQQTLQALTRNNTVVFSTLISGNQHCEKALNDCIASLKQDPTWQNLHRVTAEKAGWSVDDAYFNATWLHVAVRNGHIETIKEILALPDFDPSLICTMRSPLYLAVAQNNVEAATLLLAHPKMDPNLRPNDDNTPLFIAAQYGLLELVKLFLNSDNVTNDHHSPLCVAAERGHFDVVKAILEKDKFDPDGTTSGFSPLYLAAQNNHVAIVKALLEHSKIDPNQCSPNKCSPLFIAAENGHIDVVNLLLGNEHVNPNHCESGYSPLFVAAEQGHIAVVNALLEHPLVDPNLCSHMGHSPLFVAAHSGHVAVVKALLEHKVNPGHFSLGYGPLHAAARNGHTHVVRELLAAGADPNQLDRNGASPLYLAVQNGNFDVVELLADHPAVSFDPITITVSELREIAKAKNIVSAMEDFIRTKSVKNNNAASLYDARLFQMASSARVEKISVTPRDIAFVMGHTDVVQLLDDKINNKNNDNDTFSLKF